MTPATQKIYVNKKDGGVSASLSIGDPLVVGLILGAGAELEVIFHLDGTVTDLEAATTGQLVIKNVGSTNGTALFLDDVWTSSGNNNYKFLGNVDSDPLRKEFSTRTEKIFGASIVWKEPGNAYKAASKPFEVTIRTNYLVNEDNTPANPDNAANYSTTVEADARYLRWLSGVTGLTGGGATNLDGLASTTLAAGQLLSFALSGVFQVWEVRAVETAEDSANGIVRFDDFHATTNKKTAVQIL